MKRWLRRIRGAAGMGLIWAAGGAGVGMLIELLANVLPGGLPMASAVDMWPQTLAMIGLLGGVVFATVLGVAAGRRRFDELSLAGFAAWGAAAGLLLGGLFRVTIGVPVALVALTAVGCAVAAAGSLALARMAERRSLLSAGADGAGASLAGDEAPELPGGGG